MSVAEELFDKNTDQRIEWMISKKIEGNALFK
jgi:hypothetical protein